MSNPLVPSKSDVSYICNVNTEQSDLNIVHHEIDSLDYMEIFDQSTFYQSVSNQMCSVSQFHLSEHSDIPSSQYFLYIPNPSDLISNHHDHLDSSLNESKESLRHISPEIAEDARMEATVLDQVAHLKLKGLWSSNRLPKIMEPSPGTTLHDSVMEEAIWLACDFAEERKWKKCIARKLAESAQSYLIIRHQLKEQSRLAIEQCRKRNAARVSQMVKEWWENVREEVNSLKQRADRSHINHILEENKLLLAVNAELLPDWLTETTGDPVHSVSQCEELEPTFSITDSASEDSDWIPENRVSSFSSESPSDSSPDTHSFASSGRELNENSTLRSEVPKSEAQPEHEASTMSNTTDQPDATAAVEPLNEDYIDPTEVQELLSEADLPINRVLEMCYRQNGDNLSKLTETNLAENTDELVSPTSMDLDEIELRDAVQDVSMDETSDVDTNSVCSSSSGEMCTWILPPWSGDFELSEKSLSDLRRTSSLLAPLLKLLNSGPHAHHKEALITAYGPSFRVPLLPSANFGAIVSWLRHAFVHTVPGLIISNSMSGDAEFAIAAHLGQLVIPVYRPPPDACNSPPQHVTGKLGSWGPHLIVTSRLCLPSWRSRLSNWCPGFRIACLGFGYRGPVVPHAPSGSGRRLGAAISRGSINICITTYAAIRSRPNRYNRIMWNVVVFDQVHNILPCSEFHRSSSSSLDDPSLAACSEGGNTDSVSRTQSSRDLIDLLVSEIHFSGHRILLTSTPDLLMTSCGFRLFELSRLLFSRYAVDTERHKSWTANLFSEINQHANVSTATSSHHRPTKKQLIRFLNPFALRLDEECGRDSCIEEEVLFCPLTLVQRQLHDTIMRSAAARNALKTGDLFDLLKTVSAATGICNHPVLATTNSRRSASFVKLSTDLRARASCHPGPFVFKTSLDHPVGSRSNLQFSTPECVLKAVRSLKDSDLSDVVLEGLNIVGVSRSPFHVRERIISLLPNRDHFFTVANENQRLLSSVATKPTEGLISSQNLSNGIPEQHITPVMDHLPLGTKRPRTASILGCSTSSSQAKRPRIDEATQIHPEQCHALKRPFFDPDALKKLQYELESNRGKSAKCARTFSSPGKGSGTNQQPEIVSPLCESQSEAQIACPPERIDDIVRVNNLRCCTLTGFADWCSEHSCSRFIWGREPSFSEDSLIATCKDRAHGFAWLFSTMFNSLIVARPSAVASPIGLSTCKGEDTSLHRIEAIRSTGQTRIPEGSSEYARWLSPPSIRSSCLVGFGCSKLAPLAQPFCSPIARLLSNSGKFQTLHRLLQRLLGSGSIERPRCVFILANRSGMLDLLEAYLDASCWRHLERVRTHSDYRAVDAESSLLVDRINSWPKGSHGPLLVLMHSRSPVSCWAGLRVGSDCVVIIVDVDWRADVADREHTVLHGWALNGLVDASLTSAGLSRTRVYRLVSSDVNSASNGTSSVEASLARGVARRLLPQSVFQAHGNVNKGRRQPTFMARVQPNVVNDLLSDRPLAGFEHGSRGFLRERDLSYILKQEAPSCSSRSSVTSSFSYPLGDARDDSTRDTSEDDYALFRERELLTGRSLQCMFELFEDPVDARAWSCSLAEQSAIPKSIFNDYHLPIMETSASSEEETITDEVKPAAAFLLDSSFHSADIVAPSLSDQFGYSALTDWEVAHHEACRYVDQLGKLVEQSNAEVLSYNPLLHEDQLSLSDANDADYESNLAELQIWNPFTVTYREDSQHPRTRRPVFDLAEDDAFDYNPETTTLTVLSTHTRFEERASPYHRYDDSDWGYESDPMSECDLPPITFPKMTSALPSPVVTPTLSHKSAHKSGLRSHLPSTPLSKRRRIGLTSLKSSVSESVSDVAQDDMSHSASLTPSIDSENDVRLSPHQKSIDLSQPLPNVSGHSTVGSNVASSLSSSPQSGAVCGISLTINQANATPIKLNIPRVCYTKDMSSSRANRLRRFNTGSMTLAELPKPLQVQGNPTPLANPSIIARYGYVSPGRQTHLTGQQSRHGSKDSFSHGVPAFGAAGTAGQFNVGKPLDWLPYEEAALYESITKLQEMPFDSDGSTQPACSPNFCLSEFFLNNYFPTRGHRGARQCLYMYSKMQNIVSAATTTLCGPGAPVANLDDSSATPTSLPLASATGRKVKNKLKSSVAAASSNLTYAQNVSGDGSPDTLAAVTRFRLYLVYQYLHNAVCSKPDDSQPPGAAGDGICATLPPYLTQLLGVLKTTEENQSKLLRKVIRDGLSSPINVPASPYHRQLNVRRQGSQTAGQQFHQTSGAQPAACASGLFAYSGSGASFPTLGVSGHSSTTPALLTHQRQRHVALEHLSSSQGTHASGSDYTSSGSLSSHGGSMIQKNPSHIAALQEHNINPDTLITPAMVLKNKEEREARLQAEAAASSSQSILPSSINQVSSVATTTSGSYRPQVGVPTHTDASLHAPVVFSMATDGSGGGVANITSGASVAVPLSLSGNQLTFAQPGQRGSGFVTIVSSHPSVLRRSTPFTSASQTAGHLYETPLPTRIASIPACQPQGTVLAIGSPTRGAIQTGYFVQQRPQFISAHQAAAGSRGIIAAPSTSGSTFVPSATPVPHIIRPRAPLRGSVIQPTYVRTLSTNSSVSNFSARFATTASLAPGRFTLTLPATGSNTSNVPASRIGSLASGSIRPSSTSVLHQIRPSVSPVVNPVVTAFGFPDSRVHGGAHVTSPSIVRSAESLGEPVISRADTDRFNPSRAP